MSMFEAYRSCLSKYASFQGRARRSEYWLFYLCNILISIVLNGLLFFAVIRELETLITVVGAAAALYSLLMLLPGLAVTVRRLHDVDLGGAYILITLIPLVGAILMLINLCTEGSRGENRYGPNPKETPWPEPGAFQPENGGTIAAPLDRDNYGRDLRGQGSFPGDFQGQITVGADTPETGSADGRFPETDIYGIALPDPNHRESVSPGQDSFGAIPANGKTVPLDPYNQGSAGDSMDRVEPLGIHTVRVKHQLKATCVKGPMAGAFAVGEVIYVGREPSLCQLVFPDTPGVSRVHCMLHTDGYTMEIQDLNSRYGTYLSDHTRLEPNKLTYLSRGNVSRPDVTAKSTVYLGSENVAIVVELI